MDAKQEVSVLTVVECLKPKTLDEEILAEETQENFDMFSKYLRELIEVLSMELTRVHYQVMAGEPVDARMSLIKTKVESYKDCLEVYTTLASLNVPLKQLA